MSSTWIIPIRFKECATYSICYRITNWWSDIFILIRYIIILVHRIVDMWECPQTREWKWVWKQLCTINNNVFYCLSKINRKIEKGLNENSYIEMSFLMCAYVQIQMKNCERLRFWKLFFVNLIELLKRRRHILINTINIFHKAPEKYCLLIIFFFFASL